MTEPYEFDISRATCAEDLHAFMADIRADENLDTDEKAALLKIIAVKFGQWNHRAIGPQKPRWD